MRFHVALLAIAGITLLSNSAIAQSNLMTEDSLILSTGCGRFHLVLGRITLDSFRYKKVRLHRMGPESTNDEEFVCVTANRGTPSLHYLRQVGNVRITVDTTDTDAVRIETKTKHPSGVSESLLLQQPCDGPIVIHSGLGDNKRQLKTESIWHLMVDDPVLYEQQIAPVFELLFDECRLQQFSAAVQGKLQARAATSTLVTEDEVLRLVERLGSGKRAQRINAQKELLKFGVGLLPLLADIDPASLDSEQRQRIEELKLRVRGVRKDTPDIVAAWLATDRGYWLSACQHWNDSEQRNADQYLLATFGKGLEYSGRVIAKGPSTRR